MGDALDDDPHHRWRLRAHWAELRHRDSDRYLQAMSVRPSPATEAIVYALDSHLRDLHELRSAEIPPGDEYLHMRELYARVLEDQGHATAEVKEGLERREAALVAKLGELGLANYSECVVALRAESALFRSKLLPDAPAAPAPNVPRGPDKTARRRAPPKTVAPKAAVPSRRRSDRNAKMDERVLRLLGRHVDGLSARAIVSRLAAGKAQVERALQRLEIDRSVQKTGIGNDSRWVIVSMGDPKTRAQKAPRE